MVLVGQPTKAQCGPTKTQCGHPNHPQVTLPEQIDQNLNISNKLTSAVLLINCLACLPWLGLACQTGVDGLVVGGLVVLRWLG